MPDRPDHHDDRAEQTGLETARDLLARNREGVLMVGGSPFRVRFITDPATGDLIAPIPREASETTDLVLFVPDESFEALQLLLSPIEIAESALTDRWCAYHLRPDHPVWCRLQVDSARHDRWVFMGEAVSPPNALADHESALCRALNADHAALGRVLERVAGVSAPEPVCVGVTERGCYIRARFSVVLARFDTPAITADEARAAIEQWLKTVSQ